MPIINPTEGAGELDLQGAAREAAQTTVDRKLHREVSRL